VIKGKLSFWRKDDIMVQVWEDRRPVRMISAVHDLGMVNMGRKDIKTNLEVKKMDYIVQYSKSVKTVDRADQYLIYYSVLKKTVKLSKKVMLCFINYALFNVFFLYTTLNRNIKTNIESFYMSYRGLEFQKQRIQLSPVLMNCSRQRRNQYQGGLNRTPQAHCLGASADISWRKLLFLGRERRHTQQDSVKLVHTQEGQ
jgi:hypothetical protein